MIAGQWLLAQFFAIFAIGGKKLAVCAAIISFPSVSS
jgi:hypothetical protein